MNSLPPMICSGDPRLVCVSIAPGRYTHRCIEETGEFVFAWAGEGQAELVTYSGSCSGAQVSKFEEFDMHVPGQGTVHFSSMHQLRAVEKHCETHGPRPFVVRQYSQDISNRNDNVFGERHNPTFSPRSSRTGIPFRQQIKVKE